MFVQLARISLGRLDTEIIPRIWDYVTRQFTFGRITVSVSSVFLGVFVVLLTIFISRWSSVLIERRLTNRRHIDPGLRYTICRLAKYVLVTVGCLAALEAAVAEGLPSTAGRS